MAASRSRGRVRVAQVFFATAVTAQALLALHGYRDPHKFFAFQPYNESSTWQAEVVRVTWDGARLSVEDEWAGYDWDSLVHMSALQGPDRRRHAYMGVDATLDFLRLALDWVATHTPADRETRYLEATVTYHENTRGPHRVVLRSTERDAT